MTFKQTANNTKPRTLQPDSWYIRRSGVGIRVPLEEAYLIPSIASDVWPP